MNLTMIKATAAVALAITLLTGCSSAPKAPTEPMKLYVFDCGTVDVKDISLFSPGVDKGKKRQLVVSCYLIKHPQGLLVWDTGLPDGLVKMPKGASAFGGAMQLKRSKTLVGQLAEIGVKPEDVKYVAFSHMHGDHSGNGNLFTNATVIMQKEEYAAAFGPDSAKFGFDKANYEKLATNKSIQLEGDYDVFGDGKVTVMRAIGHTPGHQTLLVDLEKSGPVMLSGDLYHFKKNRENKGVPSFNFNKELTLQAMEKIEKATYDKKARFWIQHDPEQNKEIAHSPSYHE
jgi:N-acyl homoserine lactone hydrolase